MASHHQGQERDTASLQPDPYDSVVLLKLVEGLYGASALSDPFSFIDEGSYFTAYGLLSVFPISTPRISTQNDSTGSKHRWISTQNESAHRMTALDPSIAGQTSAGTSEHQLQVLFAMSMCPVS